MLRVRQAKSRSCLSASKALSKSRNQARVRVWRKMIGVETSGRGRRRRRHGREVLTGEMRQKGRLGAPVLRIKHVRV